MIILTGGGDLGHVEDCGYESMIYGGSGIYVVMIPQVPPTDAPRTRRQSKSRATVKTPCHSERSEEPMLLAGGAEMHGSFAARDTVQDDSAVVAADALANSRQLLSAQHVDDAIAADAALQHHRATGSLLHFPDPNRAF